MPTEKYELPLYRKSLPEAYQDGDSELWLISHRLNVECRDYIDQLVREHFSGNYLDGEISVRAIEKYGIERVGWVLANTVQQHSWDGRFRPHNHEWAKAFPIPEGRNYEFVTHMLYDEQTKRRNALNSESIDEFNELCMLVEQGLCTNPKIVKMVTDLSDRLKTVKGKKQYGYLPKSVKAMVDGIVDELEEDERIKRLYDLWYECKCLIYQTYTDVPPKRLPLSQENAFKPIRNAVIKRASELAFGLADDEPIPQENSHTSDTSTTTSGTSSGGNTTSSTSTHTSPSTQPTSSNQYKPQILTKVTRLGKDIADTFRDRYQEMVDNPAITVDSKLKREIEAKKKGQRLSM